MSNIEKKIKLRQDLENSTKQDLLPQEIKKNKQHDKKEEIFIEKNSMLSSYNTEMEKKPAIERLKYEYGIEKNIVLTKENVELNRKLIEKYVELFSSYPDYFLDLILPAESDFHLFFYQRIKLSYTIVR